MDTVVQFLKNRWAERSTKVAISVIVTALIGMLKPEYREIAMNVAIALGVVGAAVPDKQ